MSVSKVRSRDSETTLRAAPTSPSCSKRARRPQLAPEVRAEALHEQLLGSGGEGRERGEAERGQAGGGLRADARHEPRRRAGEALARLHAVEHDEAGWLLRVGGDLRDELVRADADRAGELRGGLDLGEQPAHRGARGEQALEVEIGLVQTHHLDTLDVRAHDRHDFFRDLAVGGEVWSQHHRLRAQPARARSWHR